MFPAIKLAILTLQGSTCHCGTRKMQLIHKRMFSPAECLGEKPSCNGLGPSKHHFPPNQGMLPRCNGGCFQTCSERATAVLQACLTGKQRAPSRMIDDEERLTACSFLKVSSLRLPGRPVWRRYILSLNLLPDTVTFSAFTITTYDPMSMLGAYVGTVLPLQCSKTSVSGESPSCHAPYGEPHTFALCSVQRRQVAPYRKKHRKNQLYGLRRAESFN